VKLLHKVKRDKAEKTCSNRAKVALANIADSSRRQSDSFNLSVASHSRNYGSLTPRTLSMICSSPRSHNGLAKHSGRSVKFSTDEGVSSSRQVMHWLSPRLDRSAISDAGTAETTPDNFSRLRIPRHSGSCEVDSSGISQESSNLHAPESEGLTQPTATTTVATPPRRNGAGKFRNRIVSVFSGMRSPRNLKHAPETLEEVTDRLQLSPRSAAKSHFGISK
jgi:hypothetical protein